MDKKIEVTENGIVIKSTVDDSVILTLDREEMKLFNNAMIRYNKFIKKLNYHKKQLSIS